MAAKPQSRSVRPGAASSENGPLPVEKARTWNRILYSLLLVWTFLSLCFPLFDTDFWWHLKTGEWILAGNGIPYVDLYTFRDSDKPWIDLHWGFQVLVTLLFHSGGVPLVTLAKAAVITAAVALSFQAGGDHRLVFWKKVSIWILPIICIVGRGNERPEMLSQLFLAAWLWIAHRSSSRPNLIWYLPLVQLVWVNCHALFVLGLVVGFCFGVDALIREIGQGRMGLEPRSEKPELSSLWIVAGLVAAACLINPYFEEGALFPLTLFRKFSVEKEFYRRNIGEFRPPIDFILLFGVNNIYLLSELLVWIMTSFSFVWLFFSKGRWSPFRLLLFAGFSHLAWQMSRNTNIFAIVSGVIACQNFADAGEAVTPSAVSKTLPVEIRRTQWLCAAIIGLCLAVVTGWWNEIGEKNKPFRLGDAPRWFIHDAAKFAGQPGFPDQAFVSNIGQAEVYVYHNGPKRRVFMDARLEVCTQRTFELYNSVLADMATGSTRWHSLFPAELPVVILDSRTSRPAIGGLLNSPTWRLVFADSAGAVFLSRSKADQLNLPMADPEPLMYPDGPPRR